MKYNNLTTLEDYTKLYEGEWLPSTEPTGVDAGLLTNYTHDLLFSMERLSLNTYSIRRLGSDESLPFTIDDSITKPLTSMTLEELHSANRLFYIDHRNQADYAHSAQYIAACDAYFYVCPLSGDFMPLGIRTNAGSDLVYTPVSGRMKQIILVWV